MDTYHPVLDYIEAYWPKITRQHSADQGTRIGLPQPYVVPSDGEMFQEMYYWDTFFIVLGLVDSPRAALVKASADNMAYLLERFGVIPNASRYYFLSRSQPPFFMDMVRLVYEYGLADKTWLADRLKLAEAELRTVWYGEAQPHKRRVYRGLSRYYDINFLHDLASCESGWDHSTRCDDRWLDHVPVDLNCLLHRYEMNVAWAHDELGLSNAAEWRARADERAATIRELHWDANSGFFLDYDYVHQRRTPTPTLAGFYPLYAGIATPEQAERVVAEWLPRFEFPGGLVTSLDSRLGRQWAYPNGWAPLQWIVTEGLDRCGFTEAAARLRTKWLDTCAAVFAQTGALWEKYNVVTPGQATEEGLYGQVRGFGWTNGVFIDFVRKLDR